MITRRAEKVDPMATKVMEAMAMKTVPDHPLNKWPKQTATFLRLK